MVPLPATNCVQVLAVAHRYRFAPAVASVLKYISPTPQDAGITVPALTGLVVAATLASQLPKIVRLPLIICCPFNRMVTLRNTTTPVLASLMEGCIVQVRRVECTKPGSRTRALRSPYNRDFIERKSGCFLAQVVNGDSLCCTWLRRKRPMSGSVRLAETAFELWDEDR